MKHLTIIVLLLAISGCTSTREGKTIAGGADGKVDYCITVLGSNLMCINAERTLGDSE